jgi:anthranilate synthase component 2
MKTRLVLVDNYDSFTWNLVQYLGELGADVRVFRNDAIDVAGIRRLRPRALVISPGPCTPDEAGVSLEAIRTLAGTLPILGVCLGHQAIGQAFGGKVVRNDRIVHGKASPVLHRGDGIYAGLPSPFEAGRYHSLVVERASLPRALAVTAWTREGEIMGLAHRKLDVEGVQFHPESVLTGHGKALLGNWLDRVRARRKP